jgi:tetratricopeptide (TPR) repeat protein
VLQELDENDAAMRAYERALALAPNMETAHYGLGILEGRTGRQGDGFYHLGMAFKLRGEYDKAFSQFAKAQPLLPAGSQQAQQVHAELAELADYLHRSAPH